jgi:hypothetical protein
MITNEVPEEDAIPAASAADIIGRNPDIECPPMSPPGRIYRPTEIAGRVHSAPAYGSRKSLRQSLEDQAVDSKPMSDG